MTAFPRTVLPQVIARPQLVGPLISVGQGGKPQVRSTLQIGWSWTESWGPLRVGDTTAEAFQALIQSYWRSGAVLDVDHRWQRALLGVGGGTPRVNGASQTGATLATDGWPNDTANVLRAGDIIRIAGLNQVIQVTANANSGATTGPATLSINAPIFVGGSPADDALLTINNPAGSVVYRAIIAALKVPAAGPDEFYDGMEITFMETL